MAWLAAAAMLFASAGPVVSGHAAIDGDCAPAIAQTHDHAAHRMDGTADEVPNHCAACHITRTVRDVGPAHAPAAAALTPVRTAEPDREPAPRTDRRTDFTRGPPVSLA